jgi:hypothetical protein
MNEEERKAKKRAFHTCSRERKHNYIPTAWTVTKSSKHATMLLCTHCFQVVNLSEISRLLDTENPLPLDDMHQETSS